VEPSVINDDVATEQNFVAEIHQAEAVISVRYDISVAEAVTVLRRISHCAGASLIDVAREVLGERRAVRAARFDRQGHTARRGEG
jgi:ANTAR domain